MDLAVATVVTGARTSLCLPVSCAVVGFVIDPTECPLCLLVA